MNSCRTIGLSCLLLLAGIANAQSQTTPAIESFGLQHQLTYKILSGKLNMHLAEQDGLYTYEVTTVPGALGKLVISGEAIETARFRLKSGRLQPLYYRLNDGLEEPDSETIIEFDWERKLARTQREGRTLEIPIKQGMMDRLSADIVAIMRLRDGKEPGNFRIVDDDSVKTYTFEYMGEEEITVPAGEFTTKKYKRQRTGSRRSILVWFAPAADYLPVRLEHQKSGKKTLASAAITLEYKPD